MIFSFKELGASAATCWPLPQILLCFYLKFHLAYMLCFPVSAQMWENKVPCSSHWRKIIKSVNVVTLGFSNPCVWWPSSVQSYVARISQQSDGGGQQAQAGLCARAPRDAAAEERLYRWERSPPPQQLAKSPAEHPICQKGSAVPLKDLEEILTPNNSGCVNVDVRVGGLTDGSALSPLMVRSALCKVWVWLVETAWVPLQDLAEELKCPSICTLPICKWGLGTD